MEVVSLQTLVLQQRTCWTWTKGSGFPGVSGPEANGTALTGWWRPVEQGSQWGRLRQPCPLTRLLLAAGLAQEEGPTVWLPACCVVFIIEHWGA